MARPLVLSRAEAGPGWASLLPEARMTGPDDLPADFSDVDSVWIDAARSRPLDLARRIHTRDPAVQTIVVTPPEDRGIHERALLVTPGLGEVWLASPDDVGDDLLGRAREITVSRRGYRISKDRLNAAIKTLGDGRATRTIVSDAYLAALLQVLPDPVISVDEDDSLASWSESAERLFGVSRSEALGRPVAQVLDPEDREEFVRVLAEGSDHTVAAEFCLLSTSRGVIVEAYITPVRVGGLSVRSIVLRDVTRERHAQRELERSVELRSRFYAAMSHEIRTPINAIMGYIELLRTDAGGVDKRGDYLDRSQRAADHLLALVNDVLDLSKIESGALQVEREPVGVSQVLAELVSTLEPLAHERDTVLETTCEPSDVVVPTDPRRLKQILMNLVSNAIKFGEGKPVRIHCRKAEDWLSIEVQDHGLGIAPEDQERIFEEFTQVKGTEGGTGLGLPISRKLARLLGGDLMVRSKPGEGSTFTVRVPADGVRRPHRTRV